MEQQGLPSVLTVLGPYISQVLQEHAIYIIKYLQVRPPPKIAAVSPSLLHACHLPHHMCMHAMHSLPPVQMLHEAHATWTGQDWVTGGSGTAQRRPNDEPHQCGPPGNQQVWMNSPHTCNTTAHVMYAVQRQSISRKGVTVHLMDPASHLASARPEAAARLLRLPHGTHCVRSLVHLLHLLQSTASRTLYMRPPDTSDLGF